MLFVYALFIGQHMSSNFCMFSSPYTGLTVCRKDCCTEKYPPVEQMEIVFIC